jgi:hypothetical protein
VVSHVPRLTMSAQWMRVAQPRGQYGMEMAGVVSAVGGCAVEGRCHSQDVEGSGVGPDLLGGLSAGELFGARLAEVLARVEQR